MHWSVEVRKYPGRHSWQRVKEAQVRQLKGHLTLIWVLLSK